MRLLASIAIAAALAGCVTTQEMPLAPNMVRLDTQARGLLFTGQAVPQTMRKAAEATISRGFTHFRLGDASMSQGSQVGGVMVQNYGGGFWGATPVNVPTANNAVTVMMFKGNPGNAFDAQQVLRQYQ